MKTEEFDVGDKIAAVRNVFTDARFHRIKNAVYGFRGEIDGTRVGVVVASKSLRFASSSDHVLNKSDLDRLIAALDANRLDAGFVVTAATDSNGNLTFVSEIEARKLKTEILNGRTTLSGKLGEFYLVSPKFTSSEEDF
jgi:hypothetical protein